MATQVKLNRTENLARLIWKFSPGKRTGLRLLPRFGWLVPYVPFYYDVVSPLLQTCFGGDNIHVGYFETGTEDWVMAQEQLTRELGSACGFDPADHILDIGCGVGGPAVTMAGTFQCRISGINISKQQLRRARELAVVQGLQDKVTFIRADACRLSPASPRYDGAYAIESVSHLSNKEKMLQQVAHSIYPGARFGIIDVALQDLNRLRNDNTFARFSAVVGVRKQDWIESGQLETLLESNGFVLRENRDLSEKIRPTEAAWLNHVELARERIIQLYGRTSYEMIVTVVRDGAHFIRRHGSYRMWVAERVG